MTFLLEYIIRIIVSTIAGLLIGQTRRNKPAGPRTFALISLGATIFTLVSMGELIANPDPTKVISNIVAGIGFLGVGVIWKTDNKLVGLTTAAAIWVTAAVGILVGLGTWELSAVSLVIVIALLYSKPLEKRIEKQIDTLNKKKKMS